MIKRKLTRRDFIKGVALAGSGLALGCNPLSELDAPPQEPVKPAMLGIWVQEGAARTPAEAEDMLARVVRGGFNTILYCIGSGSAAYHSSLLDWGRYVTSEYDPLAYVVEQAHAKNLKIQAWWCPGAMMRYGSFKHRHPEWDIAAVQGVPDELHWSNFSLPEVRRFVVDVVAEVVENYEVDGVHLDYIRYPAERLDESFNPDDVPLTVQSVYRRMKNINPGVQLTAAALEDQRASVAFMQNWADWLAGEYIDHVMPMAYFSSDQNHALQRVVDEWQNLPHPERIVPGLSVVTDFESETPKTPEQLLVQAEMCRAGGWKSGAFFDEHRITDELLDAMKGFFASL